MRRTKASITKGLGGPYIHIDRDPSSAVLKEIELYLRSEVGALVRDRFSQELSVQVEVTEGSIKAYVFLGGFALFEIVSGYGSFRSGIDHIVSDVQLLSEAVFDRFLEHEEVSEKEIIYKARRLGVPGKVQRYLRKLDRLDDYNVNADERVAFVEELKDDFLDILTLLEHERDRELVMDQTPKMVRDRLPSQLPKPIKGALDLRYEQPEYDFKFEPKNAVPDEPRKPLPIPEPKSPGNYLMPPPNREDGDV